MPLVNTHYTTVAAATAAQLEATEQIHKPCRKCM